jgi:fermentation-respiration switch protein FrsA (DUF1100 family)
MRTDIEFDADATTLRGWLYTPGLGDPPYPTVIMAHGLTARKEHGLDAYAEVFSAAGLAVLVYDNRNLGASDGQPRGEVDPSAQLRDYGHAITHASGLYAVDEERIGIWGTSYTGGLVLTASAIDRRVKCVVSQVPYLHGLETLELTTPPTVIERLHRMIDEERKSLAAGNPPRSIEAVRRDPSAPATSPENSSYDFFAGFASLGVLGWENKLTIRSLWLRLEYDALSFVDRVSPTPMLMIVATDDSITPTSIALRTFDRALEPKKLVMIEGHHYQPYLDGFPQSSSAARDWFVEHLATS